MITLNNSEERQVWIAAINGYRYNSLYKNLNDKPEAATIFADLMVEEFRKRILPPKSCKFEQREN